MDERRPLMAQTFRVESLRGVNVGMGFGATGAVGDPKSQMFNQGIELSPHTSIDDESSDQ